MNRYLITAVLLMLSSWLRAQSLPSPSPDGPLLWIPSQGALLSPSGGDAAGTHFTIASETINDLAVRHLAVRDSLYLIRPERYRFYRRLHRYMADTVQYPTGASLLASYQRSLLRSQAAYDQLLLHYHTADSLSARTLRTTQATLHQLQHVLDRTQLRLGESEQALHTAHQQAQRQRRRSFLRGLAYGSGLGVGLMTLLFLAAP